jgi:hypothetical protein
MGRQMDRASAARPCERGATFSPLVRDFREQIPKRAAPLGDLHDF